MLERIDTCHNNPKKSSTNKINKHITSGYSLFTHCLVDATKNKLNYYNSKGCMKKNCEDLKEHATKIINCEKKKEMIPLTYEESKFYKKQKNCYICKKEFNTDKEIKMHLNYIIKYEIIVIMLDNIEELLIIFVI